MGLIALGAPLLCQDFLALFLHPLGGRVSGWLGQCFPRGSLTPRGYPGCACLPPPVPPLLAWRLCFIPFIGLHYCLDSSQVLGVVVGAAPGGY